MNHERPDDREHVQQVDGTAASAELWLDEALAETFPASDPIPWRREVLQPAEAEATGAMLQSGAGQ